MTRRKNPRVAVAVAVLLLSPLIARASGGMIDHAAEMGMTHRMMVLMLQLGIILFAARAGGMLFERLRLPSVLGELFSGVLIGPSLLGALQLPGFPNGLFHLGVGVGVGNFPVSPELYGICTLASVVLLFLVGLETDIKLLMRYSLVSSLVGSGGVAVSFLLGNLATVWFSPFFFGQQLGPMAPPCILLGVISTATSVGISARILSERKQLDSPEGVTILASAVVDDVLGIILLAVGMGVITASGAGSVDWGHIGRIAAKAFGVWLAATAIGLLWARRISTLLKTFRHRTVIAVMALGLAILLAGLFEEAGLAMIIGAYVMGLSLSGTDLTHVIQEKLHVLHVLLVPVFFAVMGMMVDVRTLGSPKVLLFGAAFTVVGVIGKIVGCGIPAMCSGFNARGALRIGVGMLPRGEVTLIIAGAGIAAGMLSPDVFGVVVFMTFAAALAAPPALIATFRSPASGLRNPKPRDQEQLLHYSFPSHEAASMLVSKLIASFEHEGFYVHTLDRRRNIYQLRKDAAVIGFHREGSSIYFACDPLDRAFVSTAMLEVLADFELTLNVLRKPLDATVVALDLQQQAANTKTSRRQMNLAHYLRPDLLIPKLQATTKEEAIDALVGALAAVGEVSDATCAREDVLERESVMSTGMQDGVAIPHARTDAVKRLVCAVGLLPAGLDFDSLDGEPARIVIMTLSPRSAAAPHMQFMAAIGSALDVRGRAALLRCATPEQMFAVLSGDLTAAPPPMSNQHHPSSTGSARSPLASYLRRDLLTTDLVGTTKEEVIDELLAVLTARVNLPDPKGVRTALLERERQMSTGMEHGVAIPHVRTPQVDALLCVFGIHRDGMDFDALDGQLSHIFVMTLSPENASAPHVQFMAAVCRYLDQEGRARILAASGPDELWGALHG